MSASTEFSISLGVSSGVNSLAPGLEWYCLQQEFCSYSAPSLKGVSSPSSFADFSEFRGNLGSLAQGGFLNEVLLTDGSSLYGSACSGGCEAILYRYINGRSLSAYCPIGSEMVVSAMGNDGNIKYIFQPSPRVSLVGDMPASCVFANGSYTCDPGQVTLRFTRSDSPCDTTSGEECPFPRVGRTHGQCLAEEPCNIELN